MLPQENKFIYMNEYLNSGKNRNKIRGEFSINQTCDKLKKIEESSEVEIKGFIRKVRNIRVKNNLENQYSDKDDNPERFRYDFDKLVQSWVINSPKCNESGIFMLDELLKALKSKKNFRDAFIFEDEKINIWLIVDEANYDVNAEYINLARKILDNEYKEIRLMIYSFYEIDEVKEELEEVDYKTIKEF